MNQATANLLLGLCLSFNFIAVSQGQTDDRGFVPLFNGKDFDGWVFMGSEEGWLVKDGIVRSEKHNCGWIRSEKQYRDFILKLEWRIGKNGNSGVFIRTPAVEKRPWLVGYEIQIDLSPRDDLHCTGTLYQYAPAKPRPKETPDEWHTFEIHCVGTRIAIHVDGVKCVDVDQSKMEEIKDKPLKGYVGLQDAHRGVPVEYRNVKIKTLD